MNHKLLKSLLKIAEQVVLVMFSMALIALKKVERLEQVFQLHILLLRRNHFELLCVKTVLKNYAKLPGKPLLE